MESTLPEALANLVAAAQGVLELLARSGVRVPELRLQEAEEWSRRLRTAEAAAILRISEHSLRRQLRAHMNAEGTALFDGISAARLCGGRYLVRLHRRWLSAPAAEDGAARQPSE